MMVTFRRALRCSLLGSLSAACGVENIELVPGAGPAEVGAAPTLGAAALEPTSSGCERVDFLFVVDNSGSMREEQENLARSFPGFVAVLQRSLRARDYHIMVVDTDASGGAAGLRA